jgi:hypothetical protein
LPIRIFASRLDVCAERRLACTLLALEEKADGTVQATWVGGSCVMVSEGLIQVD